MSNEGKKVKAHYTGTLDDGTKFDSSLDRGEPIEFTCMAGQMIKGFDAAVKDMTVGETKTVHIAAADAYGEYDPAKVQHIPAAQVQGADQLQDGQRFFLSGPMGQPIAATLKDGIITVDLNHELAGKDLNFEITLVEVAD
ncbi:FKBP-type peptidyl-prolyl cis-trans isomerase [Adlercreutzia sp. ZJ141]|uniref:FKBP-type peptidyl-prolyl cis-trans isomerase n=1 Tax=Adlercreutzia sp. ZJ141 TaxID=2709406 RepID=UPI0013ECD158|nr:peptidylprolyl isomerase [Adlercreutzia sp. ZJ141]